MNLPFDPPHPRVVLLVLVPLLLCLLARQEPVVLPELPDRALALLLVQRLELVPGVALHIRVVPFPGGEVVLELGRVRGDGYGLVRLERQGLAGCTRESELAGESGECGGVERLGGVSEFRRGPGSTNMTGTKRWDESTHLEFRRELGDARTLQDPGHRRE